MPLMFVNGDGIQEAEIGTAFAGAPLEVTDDCHGRFMTFTTKCRHPKMPTKLLQEQEKRVSRMVGGVLSQV